MTPKEALLFSARMRTNLDERHIQEKVKLLIKRLGLLHCQNTRIGGYTVSGISGGERKRTSIGYELITEPQAVLLDEPTSGLDSSTALRIMRLLHREAVKNQKTIVCTLHQPSGNMLLECVEKVILL